MADRLFKANEVNEELAKKLDNHETFFGDNSAFPPTEGLSFEHMLAMRGRRQPAVAEHHDPVPATRGEEPKGVGETVLQHHQQDVRNP